MASATHDANSDRSYRIFLYAARQHPVLAPGELDDLIAVRSSCNWAAWEGVPKLEDRKDIPGWEAWKRSPARRRWIEANLGLVITTAWSFHPNIHKHVAELVATGNIGLIKAVDQFDPNLGNEFSTPAVTYIKNAMRDFLRRPVRDEDSLDAPVNRDGDLELSDTLVHVAELLPEDAAEGSQVTQALRRAVDERLTPGQKRVMELVLPLDERRVLRDFEAARELGVRRQAVNQAKDRALPRLLSDPELRVWLELDDLEFAV